MSGKKVKQYVKAQKKAVVKIATSAMIAYKMYLNNQTFPKRVKTAVLIIFKRYK